MNTLQNNILLIDRDLFRMMMREAKDVLRLAELPKYDLMNEEGLKLYDFWSSYVLNDIPSKNVNSPGYKMAFIQVMSVLLALKSEKKNYGTDISEHPQEKIKSNIINFLSYKKK